MRHGSARHRSAGSRTVGRAAATVIIGAVALAGASLACAQLPSHGLDSLTLPARAVSEVRLVEGELQARVAQGWLGGSALTGATIEGERPRGGSAVYEIARVVREDHALPPGYSYRAGSTWLYELRYRDAASGEWKPFCGRDAEGARLAIPLAGVYDESNTAHTNNARMTFACTRGVMAKCYRWGYRPWLSAEMAAAHQACIRMAMADYCGDGRSWTRDGTLIQRWDLLSPPAQPRTSGDPRMTFEAAWTPAGAACMARPRWPELSPTGCKAPIAPCATPEEAPRTAVLFNGSMPHMSR
jgi:hypothetical protein